MPLQIVRNDITQMQVDAIVNAANESLLGGGGVDGCIHRAAGPGLLAECRTLGGCRTGSAKVTRGYRLPCKYVIHTVGPIWDGGQYGERELLVSCYRTSLALALEYHCETVAFPLISSGVYGYPKDQALRVAVDTISAFLAEHEMMVYIVIYDRAAYQIGNQLFTDIAAYIDDVYVDEHEDAPSERQRRMLQSGIYHGGLPRTSVGSSAPLEEQWEGQTVSYSAAPDTCDACAFEDNDLETSDAAPATYRSPAPHAIKAGSLDDALARMEAGFSETLLHMIDASGMTDAECYKKANIDRKLFHKIRTNRLYKPSKPTVIAFALALELSLDDTRDLLAKAGYALSHASRFDIIVEYCIQHGQYNVFEINEILFAFDQNLIGAL